MKRSFYALLFAAGTAFSLGSCMNGDYDANPKADLSKVSNPSYDPGNGTVARGIIRCKVNGQTQTFTAAAYTENGSTRLIGGAFPSNGGQKTTSISLSIVNYSGAKTYSLNGVEAIALHSSADLSNPQDALIYSSTNSLQAGSGELKVTDDANNEMKGEFSFIAYKSNPTESATEKIEVTEGKFYVAKP